MMRTMTHCRRKCTKMRNVTTNVAIVRYDERDCVVRIDDDVFLIEYDDA